MDSIVAMKASIQRQLAQESGKKAQRAMPPGSAAAVNRSRIPPNMARVINTGAQVGVIQVKEEQSGAGPSRIMFKGPNSDASSRKDRACEFRDVYTFSLCLIPVQTGTCMRRSQKEAKVRVYISLDYKICSIFAIKRWTTE